MTSRTPPLHQHFVAEAARLLAEGPVAVPGHELRTAEAGWIDLSADSGTTLTVTFFPAGDEEVDLSDSWLVAARPDEHYRYQRVDRNGQCRIRGLPRGEWAVRLLPGGRSSLVSVDASSHVVELRPGREISQLLESVMDDEPLVCCDALDALRALADGTAWPAREIAPIVRQLTENSEAFVRQAAAEVLGEVGGTAAVAPLLAAADDPVWSVQHAAVVSLELLGNSAATNKLAEISADPGRDPAVRQAAAETLERFGEAGRHESIPVTDDPRVPSPALDMASAAPVTVEWFTAIDPVASMAFEQDGVALLVHPDPFGSPDTVVLAVAPGDALAGYRVSLQAIGVTRTHSGVLDRLGQLQLRRVNPSLRYELAIHSRLHESGFLAAGALVDASVRPVLVRGASVSTRPDPVTLLEVSDPEGRTLTISRSADNRIIAKVIGLGITDRRLIVRLPVQVGSGPTHLLAPLRWNHTTNRCGARLVLRDTDRLDVNGLLEVDDANTLSPELTDAITASVPRARGETVDAWSALAAEPSLAVRTRSVIRSALGGSRVVDNFGGSGE